MDVPRGRRDALGLTHARAFTTAVVLFVTIAAYTIITAAVDGALSNERGLALGLVLLALATGLGALIGWRLDRRTIADRIGRTDELEKRVAEAEERAERESGRAQRIETERDAEREWHREFRAQLIEAHHEGGVLGDASDIRALVLRVAVTLLESEKGLLLSRTDEDGDGDLDLVAYQGFDNDPEHSAIAQRFAGRVLDRDETVREDAPRQSEDGERGSEADSEIENLVAIPIYIRDRFSGVVVCANRDGGFEEWDDDVLIALGDHAGAVLDNSRLQGELRGAYLGTVRVLAEAIQAKDPFLRGHSEEVSGYVAAVADRLGVDSRRREELVFGSLLHDVGKIGISERILLKPAALTPEERTLIELHPRIGYRLVEQVPALRPIAGAILHHHERYDGDGYPAGLAGEAIPLEARIICVADSFSAMTAERPYRGRMSLEQACAELERCAGTQFDPQVVEAFVEEVRRDPFSGDGSAAAAMEDPQVDAHRHGDEPVLGFGAHAIVDNLTLLYSHRYFHEAVEAAAVRAADGAEPFSVVLAELTELAHLNRLEGYPAGDEAIQNAARAVQRAAVLCGGTACRYSGRRLALIAPSTTGDEARRLAATVASELHGGARVAVGAAEWQPGDTGFDVVARARLAMAPAAAPAG
jgi:diguanylate cyclase (GGDEF)-like protein